MYTAFPPPSKFNSAEPGDIQFSGGGNTSSSKQDGVYIIKHIQHNFTQDGGEYSYSQNLGLARN